MHAILSLEMPGRRKPITEIWVGFAKASVPPGASAGQKRDMKMSFYAGAQTLLVLLLEETKEGAQSGIDMLSDAKADIHDFVAKLQSN